MSESNWNYLYRTAPENIKRLLYQIPEEDINHMSRGEAIDYVKSYISKKMVEPKQPNPLRITSDENMLKFDMFQDSLTAQEPVLAYKHNERLYNILLSKNEPSALQQLTTRTGIDTLRTLEHMPQHLQSIVSFDSIKLARRGVLLDSRNRALSNDAYQWYFTTNIGNIGRGQVNTRQIITQIVEISCAPFRIPIMPNQSVNFYKNIRVGISDFDSEGIEITTNNQFTKREYYHFDCACIVDGAYIIATPITSWRPGRPIAQCDQITLKFFGNSELITLQPDYMYCTYAPGNNTLFTTTNPHNLATGDLVYVESGELHNNLGYRIWVVSLREFQILAPNIEGGNVIVYFASKRIQIELNFVCLEN